MKRSITESLGDHKWLPYVAALVCVFAATLLRMALQPLTGNSIPFVTYFAATLLLAWSVGFGPAALAVLLSIGAGGHFILAYGTGRFFPSGGPARATIVGFMAVSFPVSYLVAALRAALRRAQAAEQQQRQVNEQLTRTNMDLKAFAFAASHDLREPLRTVSTYSEFLIEATQQGRQREAEMSVRFIVEGTQRMRQLLDDLLVYTQLNIDDKDDPPERVDLSAIVEQILRNLNTIVQQSRAVVTHASLPVVRGREVQFVQLFQNLVENAIKYSGDRPPQIQITAERMGAEWRVAVKDNGIGIDPPYREQIFGLFKRLHGGKIPGTGVGLAICRRVVESYGGKIWVESEAGSGSTFYFTLPVWESVPSGVPTGPLA